MRESSTRHQARGQKRGERRVQVRMMAGESLKVEAAFGKPMWVRVLLDNLAW